MQLLAKSTRKGYCPKCGNKLPDVSYNSEMVDGVNYWYFNCGKCEASVIEEVYNDMEEYQHSNAWKLIDTK